VKFLSKQHDVPFVQYNSHMNRKIIIPRDIAILLVLAIFLTLSSVILFKRDIFLYLIWNLFLAFLPFVISSLLLWYSRNKKGNRLFYVGGGILWLLLFPNAPYIVTDIIHVGREYSVEALYNSFLLFSCALSGLLLAFYSLNQIEEILGMKYSKKKTHILIVGILLLTSLGLYLGRFLRFNSWDIITDPLSLGSKIYAVLFSPSVHKGAYAFIGLFFVFIYATYMAWKQRNTR
jgi:uncharacterized membrane protein